MQIEENQLHEIYEKEKWFKKIENYQVSNDEKFIFNKN
jgi:hypothetical protein